MHFTFMQYRANFIPFYHRWGICMLISLFYALCHGNCQNVYAFLPSVQQYSPKHICILYLFEHGICQNVFFFFYCLCSGTCVFVKILGIVVFAFFTLCAMGFFFLPLLSFRLFLLYHSTQSKMLFKFENQKCSDVKVKCHKIT